MNQETINPSTINLRSKGVINHSGKLHRGCVKDATTKLSIGSIPSPYESIIYKTDSKKAFGTSQKRFYEKQNASTTHNSNIDDISTIQSQASDHKVNHNRLGQNSFVSKQKRDWYRCVKTPGPTHYYNKQNQKNDVPTRKCFTRQYRKNVQNSNSPAKKQSAEQQTSPGPGQYIYQKKEFWNRTYKGWKSSFQTRVGRDGYIPESISPGPGYYKFVQQKIQKINKTQYCKQQKKNNQKNILAEILKQEKNVEPGPFSYNQQIPSFKPLYQRIKMSSNFMAQTFNGKRKYKGPPGPTDYPVKRIYEDLKPKLIQSTFFMSQTRRQPFINPDAIGPNINPPPKLQDHKNFHFNIKNQWVC